MVRDCILENYLEGRSASDAGEALENLKKRKAFSILGILRLRTREWLFRSVTCDMLDLLWSAEQHFRSLVHTNPPLKMSDFQKTFTYFRVFLFSSRRTMQTLIQRMFLRHIWPKIRFSAGRGSGVKVKCEEVSKVRSLGLSRHFRCSLVRC